jgi:hypothetical protein
MRSVLEFLFRCQHRRTTFPLTRGKRSSSGSGTYIVCLDCGREFPYNWQEMRIETPAARPAAATRAVTPELSHANR